MAKSLLIKSAKILKYGPGIYKQLLFGSTNSILCSIYGTVQDCKDILPIQIPLHCPAKSTYCSIFRLRRYCAVLPILELKPAMLR